MSYQKWQALWHYHNHSVLRFLLAISMTSIYRCGQLQERERLNCLSPQKIVSFLLLLLLLLLLTIITIFIVVIIMPVPTEDQLSPIFPCVSQFFLVCCFLIFIKLKGIPENPWNFSTLTLVSKKPSFSTWFLFHCSDWAWQADRGEAVWRHSHLWDLENNPILKSWDTCKGQDTHQHQPPSSWSGEDQFVVIFKWLADGEGDGKQTWDRGGRLGGNFGGRQPKAGHNSQFSSQLSSKQLLQWYMVGEGGGVDWRCWSGHERGGEGRVRPIQRRSNLQQQTTWILQPEVHTHLATALEVSAFRLGGMRNRRGLEQQQQQQHPGQQQQLHAQPTMHALQQQHIPLRQEQLQKQRSFEKPVNKRMEVDQMWPHETQSERGCVA